jgi:catechol 2,3-dioxygenase-like lactoylglutathione lyase family enzyme
MRQRRYGAPMGVTGFQHAALDVDDLDAAVSFYEQALGFTIAPRPASLGMNGAWLQLPGAVQLHLVEVAELHPPKTAQHLAFGVDDLDATLAAIHAAGYESGEAFDIGAGKQAFLRDPAGNLLELNQPT